MSAHAVGILFGADAVLGAEGTVKIGVIPEAAVPVPVSYTHLDVYKRQLQGLPVLTLGV